LRLNTYIADEIHAFATIRDIALAEAEKEPNSLNVERARIANEFVANAVKQARTPYEGQNLPESDAQRERESCEAANVRIALLRAHLAAMEQTDNDDVNAVQQQAAIPSDSVQSRRRRQTAGQSKVVGLKRRCA